MKKHICNKGKTVEVDEYIAIRDTQVVIVKPYKRCPPTNTKEALLGAAFGRCSSSYSISKILNCT